MSTQEVTYGTLLRSERARAHGEVAGVLESLDHGEQHVEAIARHYLMAGSHAKALDFLERAALKARRASAVQEAKHHLYEAVQCSAALGDDEANTRRRIWLTLRWAEACIFSPSKDQVGLLEDAFDRAQALNDPVLALQCLYWISWIYYSVGEQILAERTIARALAKVTELTPPGLASLMRMHLGYCLVSQRRLAGRRIIRAGLAERDRDSGVSGQRLNDTDGYGMALLGLAYADAGDFSSADELVARGLEVVRASGRRPAESSVLIIRSVVEIFRSNWEGVVASTDRSREIAAQLRAPYHLATADVLCGYSLFRMGEEEEGLAAMWRGLADLEGSGAFLTKCLSQACVADALSRRGLFAESELMATAALDRAAVGDVVGEEYAYRALLRQDALGPANQAAARVDALRRTARLRHSRRQAAICDLAEADTALRQGRHHEAAVLASSARHQFENLAMPGDLAEAEALLAVTGSTTSPHG